MLYPAMSELLKHVESRYLLVNVVAHRARQLSIESELTHEPLTDKPIKRLIQEARERGMLIDASFGRKTKSVLLMDTDHVILASVSPEILSARMEEKPEPEEMDR